MTTLNTIAAREVDRVLATLADANNAEIAEAGVLVSEQVELWQLLARRMKAEAFQRLRDADAKLIPTAGGDIALEPGRKTYEWDVEGLSARVDSGFIPDLVMAAIEEIPPTKPTFKVDTRKLLAIANKLGAVQREAIMACCAVNDGAPTVRFNPPSPRDLTGDLERSLAAVAK